MLEIIERTVNSAGNPVIPIDVTDDAAGIKILTLSHSQREKGRLRALAEDGEEIRLFLPRGRPLVIGECLRGRCGRQVRIAGAREKVLSASCEDWQVFSRACYHLGNRHTKLQLGERWLRLLPDHVLEQLLIQLGLTVRHERHVFIPESGAYRHDHHNH